MQLSAKWIEKNSEKRAIHEIFPRGELLVELANFMNEEAKFNAKRDRSRRDSVKLSLNNARNTLTK